MTFMRHERAFTLIPTAALVVALSIPVHSAGSIMVVLQERALFEDGPALAAFTAVEVSTEEASTEAEGADRRWR